MRADRPTRSAGGGPRGGRAPRWGLALALVLLASGDALAQVVELVRFQSAPTPLGGLAARQAQARGEAPQPRPGDPITGYLARPDGPGPFPAVVHLHDCDGLAPVYRTGEARLPAERARTAERDWVERWVGAGWAVLLVDSLTPRAIPELCSGQAAAPRVGDAYGALRHLAGLPFVDPRRVAVVGFSHGGLAALGIAQRPEGSPAIVKGDHEFRAVVAFYPGCDTNGLMDLPTLILTGESDTASSAEGCREMMARRTGEGAPVRLVTYPGARHLFDEPSLAGSTRMFGHPVAHDEAATREAADEVRRFLADAFR